MDYSFQNVCQLKNNIEASYFSHPVAMKETVTGT